MTPVDVELLHAAPETSRAQTALDALAAAAARQGSRIRVTTQYACAGRWLLLWGPGAPDRIEAIQRHVAAGGRVIALDLAYWSRGTKVRVSIDGPHPQAFVMARQRSEDRWRQDPELIANRWNPTGPIIVAGLGRKARVQYGAASLAWEAAMMAEAATRWPASPVLYRRKTPDATTPPGAVLAPEPRTIEQILAGASLLITWHSNVSVDAIRLGIPVVCRDGAAAAVCPSTLTVGTPQPLAREVQRQFLANLAWFQWAPEREATACWRFIRELLT